MKPRIILSRCFSQPVRYNGGIVHDEFINKIKNYVDFIDVCPEVEIGLGIPRKKLIIIEDNNSKKLFQPETHWELTEIMIQYAQKNINSIKDVDGFVLKAKSPSCGVGSTKLYKNNAVVGKTFGFFAEEIKKTFPYLPLEDEGRLKDEEIRKHFLIRIFAFAELREFLKNAEPKNLVQFHSRYKYLLMTYSQKSLKELGQLVSDGKIPFKEKIYMYKNKFYESFFRKPSTKRHVNTLMHLMGYVSKKINHKEKEHLINLINTYSKNKIQLKVIIELLKSLAYRFNNEYILIQKYLEPYPEDLDV